MKPKQYLKHLETIIETSGDIDEIEATKYRLEGATMIYKIMSEPWRKAQKKPEAREKRREQSRKYYQEHKEYFKKYQQEYRRKK